VGYKGAKGYVVKDGEVWVYEGWFKCPRCGRPARYIERRRVKLKSGGETVYYFAAHKAEAYELRGMVPSGAGVISQEMAERLMGPHLGRREHKCYLGPEAFKKGPLKDSASVAVEKYEEYKAERIAAEFMALADILAASAYRLSPEAKGKVVEKARELIKALEGPTAR
jgi:uncharacterized membrane protein